MSKRGKSICVGLLEVNVDFGAACGATTNRHAIDRVGQEGTQVFSVTSETLEIIEHHCLIYVFTSRNLVDKLLTSNICAVLNTFLKLCFGSNQLFGEVVLVLLPVDREQVLYFGFKVGKVVDTTGDVVFTLKILASFTVGELTHVYKLARVVGEFADDVFVGDPGSYEFNADSGETYYFQVEEGDDGVYGAPFTLTWSASAMPATAPTNYIGLAINSTQSALVASMSPNTYLSVVATNVPLANGDQILTRITRSNNPNMAFYKSSYVYSVNTQKQIIFGRAIGAVTGGLTTNNFSGVYLVSTPGTIKELVCKQISASGTGGTHVGRLRVNETLSALTATVSTVGGVSINSTGSIAVTVGDRITFAATVASGAAGVIQGALGFYPDTAGNCMLGMTGNVAYYLPMGPVYGGLDGDANNYYPTQQTLDGTDRFYLRSFICPLAGTIKNLAIHQRVGSFGTGVGLKFSINKNGTTRGGTVYHTGPGTFSSTTDGIAVSPGDFISIEGHDLDFPHTGGAFRFAVGYVYNVASTNKGVWVSYDNGAYEANDSDSTGHTQAHGFDHFGFQSTPSTAGWQMAMAATVEAMYAYVTYPPYFTSSSTSTSTPNPNDLSWSDLNQTNWGALSSLCRDSVSTTWVCTEFEEGTHN